MAEANLHKDLELSSSSSNSDSSSEKDSRLEPSSDGEIFSLDPFCNGDGNEHL